MNNARVETMEERNKHAEHGAGGSAKSKAGHDHDHHAGHGGGSHHDHHAMMVADFRRRFFISLAVTIPILLLSPMLQEWLGLEGWRFPGDLWTLLGLSTLVYAYGGWPFLKGLAEELSQ